MHAHFAVLDGIPIFFVVPSYLHSMGLSPFNHVSGNVDSVQKRVVFDNGRFGAVEKELLTTAFVAFTALGQGVSYPAATPSIVIVREGFAITVEVAVSFGLGQA